MGFHNGDIQVAVDNRSDPPWRRNIQRAPRYRRDLDLVVIGPEGEIAVFCTLWFDDVTRGAYFEPVATVPAHQRRGLGKAVMTEGLRRLQHMGATTAFRWLQRRSQRPVPVGDGRGPRGVRGMGEGMVIF